MAKIERSINGERIWPAIVVWVSVTEPPRVVSRHMSVEAARRAADRRNLALSRRHPGANLLCGYEVRTDRYVSDDEA